MPEEKDLFHLDRVMTPKERRSLRLVTRGKKHGHAAQPGTGPAGSTCGNCKFLRRRQIGQWPNYKCGLMHKQWTEDSNTDVRMNDPGCSRWRDC
jgi:hypothetical protein